MAAFAKLLVWLLRAAVFFFLFGLALKNSDMVTLRFFFGHAWTAPVAAVILAAFAIGAVVGLTAVSAVFRRNKNNTAAQVDQWK
jgi:uncharacterized integral membrane protein